MTSDYRNTEFCEELGNIQERKQKIANKIVADHPGERDMYKYISPNQSLYKNQFIGAYNGKCSYCGVSIKIISKELFEIDHFIYKKHPSFSTVADAGYIENLVLACRKCNRSKSSLEIPNEAHQYLHPDNPGIRETFFRDDDFYIKINPEKQDNHIIRKFYSKLKLGAEIHRLDFLLISMRGLKKQITNKPEERAVLDDAIELLQTKRNLMT